MKAQLAREFLLEFLGDSAELQATLALMQVPAGFVSLTSLAFRAADRLEEAHESVIMMIMAVSWLKPIGQAKGLVSLSIDQVSLPHLPSLAQIWHLQLAVSVENFSRLAMAPVLAIAGTPAETSP